MSVNVNKKIFKKSSDMANVLMGAVVDLVKDYFCAINSA
jgi:hypothetical protein